MKRLVLLLVAAALAATSLTGCSEKAPESASSPKPSSSSTEDAKASGIIGTWGYRGSATDPDLVTQEYAYNADGTYSNTSVGDGEERLLASGVWRVAKEDGQWVLYEKPTRMQVVVADGVPSGFNGASFLEKQGFSDSDEQAFWVAVSQAGRTGKEQTFKDSSGVEHTVSNRVDAVEEEEDKNFIVIENDKLAFYSTSAKAKAGGAASALTRVK